MLLLALLAPPLLWFGVIYLGSLFALLANAFFGIDDFTGQVVREFTLQQLRRDRQPGQPGRGAPLGDHGRRRHAGLRASSPSRWPTTWRATPRGAQKALLYIAVMLPLWSSYLVRLYAWKLLLAQGRRDLLAGARAAPGAGCSTRVLSLPVDRRAVASSFSAIGTFIVFVYMWLPFMILPMQAAHRAHSGLATSKPRATWARARRMTFRKVILPLAMPGIAAGSIFTFSLTLGDYIIPQVIGDSTRYIGQVVYMQQGVAGNLPFAAAFSLVPIVVIGVYLWLAKRLGAFDAL